MHFQWIMTVANHFFKAFLEINLPPATVQDGNLFEPCYECFGFDIESRISLFRNPKTSIIRTSVLFRLLQYSSETQKVVEVVNDE